MSRLPSSELSRLHNAAHRHAQPLKFRLMTTQNEGHAAAQKRPKHSRAWIETIAGLSAGAASTLAVHPLDVIKTRLQIYKANHPLPATPSTIPGAAPVHATSLTILRSLLAQPRPIASLYRGLTPNLLGNSTSWALFFTFKSLLETPLASYRARHQYGHSTGRLTPADYFVTSTVSGMLVTLATNPIWVLKTRFLSTDATATGSYQNLWSGIREISRKEGYRGFYRGLGVSLVGVSHGGVQFAVYEPLKQFWVRWSTRIVTGGIVPGGERDEKPSTQATLAISSLAKITAGVVTYPYQVVRSRLQTYDSEVRFGKGIKEVSKRVWHESGTRGFYRGVGMNTIRVLPATWVTFLVYENVRWWVGRE